MIFEGANVFITDEARKKLVELCTQYDCSMVFAGGTFAIDFRELGQFVFYSAKGRGIDAADGLVTIVKDMVKVAHAFPTRDQTSKPERAGDLPELTACRFCRALFFRTPTTTACMHCGAPAHTAFETAQLQNEGAA